MVCGAWRAVRNNLWDWQSLQPDSGSAVQFFDFCDALEVDNSTGTIANETGFGQEHAVKAWGDYFRETYYAIRMSMLVFNRELELICFGACSLR